VITMKGVSNEPFCEEEEDFDILEAEALEAEVRQAEHREGFSALRPMSLGKKVSFMLLVLTCFDGFISCKFLVVFCHSHDS